jgi:uncharacterized membrane protein
MDFLSYLGANVDHADDGVYRAESGPAVSACLQRMVAIAACRAANLSALAGIFRRMATTENVPPSSANLPSSAKENLEVLSQFKDREEAQISGLQLAIERVSRVFGSPAFFAFALVFIAIWIAINLWGMKHGWRHVDRPPFFWLQGLVSCNALLLTVAVLIRQNRMAQVAEHRAHLDLQINLLTEQKVTKLLQMIDAPRRDLTAPHEGHDDEVHEMTKPADAHALMHAIKEKQEDR